MLRVALPPSHPGETLADELVVRHLTANALALKLRVPANRITDIVRGRRALTAETALRLGRYFGTGAKFWVDLQAAYDLAAHLQHRRTASFRQAAACTEATTSIVNLIAIMAGLRYPTPSE